VNSEATGVVDPHFFARWLRGTFYGWLLGFVLVILGALAGGAIGMGESQFIVGVGMGAGVGFVQARTAKRWLDAPWRWTGASLLGLGAPFIAIDLLGLTGVETPNFVPVWVLAGGLLAGWLQRGLLRRVSGRSGWWVAASGAGWTLAAVPAMIGGLLPRSPWVALVNLVLILSGGLILGAVTGGALVRMVPRELSGAGSPVPS
jgi:hypothetical protein